MTSGGGDILDALPHRPPFRFISSVLHLHEREAGEAVWHVSGDEAFFAGHFPGRPIVPGVLITEALAQLSGLVAFYQGDEGPTGTLGKLAHVDVRFLDAVRPPADIALRARVARVYGGLWQFEAHAAVGGAVVSRGRLTLADPTAQQQQED